MNTPRSLNVVNGNSKVEELRNLPASPRPKTLGDETVIDRALDPTLSPAQRDLREEVIDALRTVFDPEIPVNVFDLGLIYGIDIDSNNRVTVTMTLTAPGCPVADQIVREVESKVENIDAVRSAEIKLTFDPPWGKDRMSEAALLELGLL